MMSRPLTETEQRLLAGQPNLLEQRLLDKIVKLKPKEHLSAQDIRELFHCRLQTAMRVEAFLVVWGRTGPEPDRA